MNRSVKTFGKMGCPECGHGEGEALYVDGHVRWVCEACGKNFDALDAGAKFIVGLGP